MISSNVKDRTRQFKDVLVHCSHVVSFSPWWRPSICYKSSQLLNSWWIFYTVCEKGMNECKLGYHSTSQAFLHHHTLRLNPERRRGASRSEKCREVQRSAVWLRKRIPIHIQLLSEIVLVARFGVCKSNRGGFSSTEKHGRAVGGKNKLLGIFFYANDDTY